MPTIRIALLACGLTMLASPAVGQEPPPLEEHDRTLRRHIESLEHRIDVLSRQIDDIMFFQRLGDIAEVDIVRLTGPPLRYQPNPTCSYPRTSTGPGSSR